jgi:hypothetical protein
MTDPNLFTGCIVWSPDGKRLACAGFGEPDSSRNGIYTIRSSGGAGLTRMTSNPGGDDLPGDYSPQGSASSSLASTRTARSPLCLSRRGLDAPETATYDGLAIRLRASEAG